MPITVINDPTPVGPTLPPDITVAELKRYLDITKATQDELLEDILLAVVQVCAEHTNRQLHPLPATATDPPVTIEVQLDGTRWIRVPDAREVDTVLLDGIEVTTWRPVHHRGGTAVHLVVEMRARKAKVTGRFGFSTTPPALKDAIYAHAARSYRERDASYADSVDDGAGGTLSYFRRMPVRVQMVYDLFKVASDTYGLT